MATKTVSKSEFKSRALELMRQVERTGEPLVVTHSGRPVLQLLPYREDPRQALERFRRHSIRYDHPLDPVAEDDWEAAG